MGSSNSGRLATIRKSRHDGAGQCDGCSGNARSLAAVGLLTNQDQACQIMPRSYRKNRETEGSDFPPAGLARVQQLQIDRCDSEQGDCRRFFCITLYAIVMRRMSNPPDETSGRNRNRVIRIEIGSAFHPPRAR